MTGERPGRHFGGAAFLLVCALLAGCDIPTDDTKFSELRVQVTDERAEPVSGTRVEVYGPPGLMKRDSTPTNGVLRFPLLPTGAYSVRISPPDGFELVETPRSIRVELGRAPVTVDVVLRRSAVVESALAPSPSRRERCSRRPTRPSCPKPRGG